jgi:hypothetical protein
MDAILQLPYFTFGSTLCPSPESNIQPIFEEATIKPD